MIFSATGEGYANKDKPPDPVPRDSGEVLGGKGDLVSGMPAPGKQSEVVQANPSEPKEMESIPMDLVGKDSAGADLEEPTHGEWLVVTRKKRNKPKNPRGPKPPDKDKIPTSNEARVKESKHVAGPTVENNQVQLVNVIKRGHGKRSRQEGKHATPTHILLRNAGIKNMTNEASPPLHGSPREFFIQPENFGGGEPKLKKDQGVGGERLFNADNENLDMELVPETQFTFDPGQTKFNPAAFFDDPAHGFVLLGKYAPSGYDLFKSKVDGSAVWRAVNKVKSVLLDGFRLKVGVGYVSFFFDRLYTLLPFEVQHAIVTSDIRVSNLAPNCITWRGDLSGVYSAKSGYAWLVEQSSVPPDSSQCLIWHKFGMAGTSWFWNVQDVMLWVKNGLKLVGPLFIVVMWWIWRARCGECIVNEVLSITDVVRFAIGMHDDIYRTFGLGSIKTKEVQWISWSLPVIDGVVLNVDGSSIGNPGPAGYGGLIRNRDGEWLCGFAGHFGISNNIHMELLAIFHGLECEFNAPNYVDYVLMMTK
ncbi:hypothetical protein RIF29_29346 [Crotalaria pallida]|uniref:RNase H type-1 domain-containing protein n=1 Tax=Crotalaria pallida TaxID=3830 RepID=A0AAN9EL75_CROPI